MTQLGQGARLRGDCDHLRGGASAVRGAWRLSAAAGASAAPESPAGGPKGCRLRSSGPVCTTQLGADALGMTAVVLARLAPLPSAAQGAPGPHSARASHLIYAGCRCHGVGAPKSPGGRYMGLCPLARRAAGRRRSPPSPTAALVTVRCRACGRVLMRRARPATLPSRSSGGPMSSHGGRPRTARECNTRSPIWGTPNCPPGPRGTPPAATAIASGARRAPSVAPCASPPQLALGAAPEPRGRPFLDL